MDVVIRYLRKKFPFRIKAIRIDGRSKFKDQWEEACQREKIFLFEIFPRSAKLYGHVERTNRTHREEFYKDYDVDLSFGENNRQLRKHEYTYNYIRPHQALNYMPPNDYPCQWKKDQKHNVSLIS